MPTGSQDKLAHCRGIRRMHLNSNMSACEQAPVSQFGSSAHGSLLRAKFQLVGVSPCRQVRKLALTHCRGVRRMHLNSNMSDCEQAPISQFGSSAHGSILRAKFQFAGVSPYHSPTINLPPII